LHATASSARSKLIRRREFTFPSAAMTPGGELAVLGFPPAEHLLSRLLDMLISVSVGKLD
jgi:hypothetical protein